MNFKGITKEGVMLLAENRFNNSKAFYEEHKPQIKALVTDPMRMLLDDLFDTLVDINPDFILDPVRCISRVRRDTRYTRDKSLYRENLWMMFRHQKNELPTPMLWFEFFPDGYDFGGGIISASPAFMEFWRKNLRTDPIGAEQAVAAALDAGFKIDGDSYKRSKADADGISGLAGELYDLKQPFLSVHTSGISNLSKPKKLEKQLIDGFCALRPFYDYCLRLTSRFNCE